MLIIKCGGRRSRSSEKETLEAVIEGIVQVGAEAKGKRMWQQSMTDIVRVPSLGKRHSGI